MTDWEGVAAIDLHCHLVPRQVLERGGWLADDRGTLRVRLGETWQTVTWARQFLYDTLVFKPEILRALVDWMGTERVVLGTDFPFDMSDLHPIASVTDAIADAAARRAILEGNAVRLLARAGYRGAAGKGDSP